MALPRSFADVSASIPSTLSRKPPSTARLSIRRSWLQVHDELASLMESGEGLRGRDRWHRSRSLAREKAKSPTGKEGADVGGRAGGGNAIDRERGDRNEHCQGQQPVLARGPPSPGRIIDSSQASGNRPKAGCRARATIGGFESHHPLYTILTPGGVFLALRVQPALPYLP